MNRVRSLILPFTLIVLAIGTSHSQGVAKGSSQTFYIDLDTQQGHASVWRYNTIGSITTLHAVVTIRSVRKDDNWEPVFRITLLGPDSTSGNSVNVTFYAANGNPPLAILVGQFDREGKRIEVETLKQTLDLNASINIDMNWSTPGVVQCKIGDAGSYSVNIPWKIAQIQATSSTGEMVIDPLVLGSATN